MDGKDRTMTKYYVEFKTWAEGRIDTPWPFVCFEETDEYRRRDDVRAPIPAQVSKSVFLTFNESSYRRFLDEHVAAVVLGAVVDVFDQLAVQAEIEKVFGPCEIIGSQEVDGSNQSLIDKMMGGLA